MIRASTLLLVLILKSPAVYAGLFISQWKLVAPGIWQTEGTSDPQEARLQKAFIVKVDLTHPHIRFVTNPESEKKGFTTGLTAPLFMKKFNVDVAINANFFTPCCADEPGGEYDPLGLVVANGKIVSKVKAQGRGADMVLITSNNKVRLVSAREKPSLKNVFTAVSGGPFLLRKGRNLAARANPVVHPRSALGISRDRRTLFLLVIDGRQPGYSDGATQSETARWLLKLGAWDGINFDGGGSTVLAIRSSGDEAKIVNRPIHNHMSGSLRVVSNFLGVKSKNN